MSSDGLRYADDLGPAKILHLHEPASGLKAIVVVDNVVLGPAIGGVRIVADAGAQGLSPDETWRPCMDALLADARRGRLAAGIEAALDALGAILRERVPGPGGPQRSIGPTDAAVTAVSDDEKELAYL